MEAKENNVTNYPEIQDAIDASFRLMLCATKNAGLENPEISTEISITNGEKYSFKFERIDLD